MFYRCLNFKPNNLENEQTKTYPSNSLNFSYKQLHRIKQELLYLFEFLNEEKNLSKNEVLKKELSERQM